MISCQGPITDKQVQCHSQHLEFRLNHRQFSMIRTGCRSNFYRLVFATSEKKFNHLSAIHESFLGLIVKEVGGCVRFPNEDL